MHEDDEEEVKTHDTILPRLEGALQTSPLLYDETFL